MSRSKRRYSLQRTAYAFLIHPTLLRSRRRIASSLDSTIYSNQGFGFVSPLPNNYTTYTSTTKAPLQRTHPNKLPAKSKSRQRINSSYSSHLSTSRRIRSILVQRSTTLNHQLPIQLRSRRVLSSQDTSTRFLAPQSQRSLSRWKNPEPTHQCVGLYIMAMIRTANKISPTYNVTTDNALLDRPFRSICATGIPLNEARCLFFRPMFTIPPELFPGVTAKYVCEHVGCDAEVIIPLAELAQYLDTQPRRQTGRIREDYMIMAYLHGICS